MTSKKISWVLFPVLILFVISIACSQSGEIISPALATQHYEATQAAKSGDVSGDAEGATYLAGSNAILTSNSYLVGLFSIAGDKVAFSFATRSEEVMVTGSLDIDGTIWYKVETMAGDGWLPEVNLTETE